MNKDVYTMPILLNPWFKFTNISDASQKYGGDNIAEYKLSVTVEYEIEIPTYIVITPHAKLKYINLDVSMDSAYSRYGLNPIFDPSVGEFGKRPDESDTREDYPDMTITTENGELPSVVSEFVERAYYKFTLEDESDDSEWFIIDNPFAPEITEQFIAVGSYTGPLKFGDYWRFNIDKTGIEVKVTPKEDELVEFFRYQ